MNWLLLLIVAYPAFYTLQCLTRIFREWRKARVSGIPYMIAPVHPENLVWMIFSPMFQKQLERYLPAWIYSRISMNIYGWEMRYKYRPVENYGSLLLLVNFYRTELTIADPDVAHEVLKRPKDFPNSSTGNFIMGKFGPNLVTSRDAEWARQRKFIAPNINERIAAAVWGESLSQAKQMMEHVANHGGKTNDTANGMKKIAINVLGAAGYGQPRPWDDDKAAESAPAGFHLTYMQAMRSLVENLVEMAFLSPAVLSFPFWPKHIKDTGHAVNELKDLTQVLLDNERQNPSEKANIMKLLIEDEGAAEKKENIKVGLYDEEIVGNLFVFSAAGFDTTANTMAYALALLAVHPYWQDWLTEEIDEVLPSDLNAELDYNATYPKLVRVQALMYETLRLFAPIVHLAKCTEKPVPVTTSEGRDVVIPADTTIYINSYALHHNPNVYKNPDAFDLDRWLAYPDAGDAEKTSGRPFIKPAPKGSFIPWSTGPRGCPGQKMSQVEFVSVFTQILREYKIEVVLKDGESPDMGRRRAEEVMNDSAPKLTMQMSRPQDLNLRFVARQR
jgi:cytochrome P450